MIENIEPFKRQGRKEIIQQGFISLPAQLVMNPSGLEESCPTLKEKGEKPKIIQSGVDLRMTHVGKFDMFGAIVKNHIVFILAINKGVAFDQTEVSYEAIYGDWDGSSVTLTNTLGTCVIKLTTAGKRH